MFLTRLLTAAGCCLLSLALPIAHQGLARELSWSIPPRRPSPPLWTIRQAGTTPPPSQELDTQGLDGGETPTPKSTLKRLPTFSIGAGVRGLVGEQPQAAIQAGIRLFQTNNRTLSSGSIRPAVILPSGCDLCNDEYRIAATLDFFQHDTLSFYVGGGVAINKDGETGKGYGMVSGGVEVNLSPTFAITGNLNLIPESDAQTDRGLSWADAETSLFLTARF